jgi:hypothetical protein
VDGKGGKGGKDGKVCHPRPFGYAQASLREGAKTLDWKTYLVTHGLPALPVFPVLPVLPVLPAH